MTAVQTMTPTTCAVGDLPKLPAAARACSECPWRKSNTDREHYNDQYSTEEFTRLWRAIAVDGESMGCHLFDADFHPVPDASLAMGYQKPADIGARRECAGVVAVIRRELRIAATYENHAEYIEARPVGLSRKAFRGLRQRIDGDLLPGLRFAADEDESDVADPMERVDSKSLNWQFDREGLANMKTTLEALAGSTCDCPVCANHTTVHAAKDLTTSDGDTAPVDEELHGLLTAMTEAGIRTIDSCINLADALDKLNPSQKPLLLRSPAGELNYRNMILREAAHIRFNNAGTSAQVFERVAGKTPGVEVSKHALMTQIIFQPSHIPVLTAYANNLKTLLSASGAPS